MHVELRYSRPRISVSHSAPIKLQCGGPATYGFCREAPGGVLVEVSFDEAMDNPNQFDDDLGGSCAFGDQSPFSRATRVRSIQLPPHKKARSVVASIIGTVLFTKQIGVHYPTVPLSALGANFLNPVRNVA
jgi:hypothetical protein